MLKPTISVTTKIVSNNKVMITIHDHKENTSFQVLLSAKELLDVKEIPVADEIKSVETEEVVDDDGHSIEE